MNNPVSAFGAGLSERLFGQLEELCRCVRAALGGRGDHSDARRDRDPLGRASNEASRAGTRPPREHRRWTPRARSRQNRTRSPARECRNRDSLHEADSPARIRIPSGSRAPVRRGPDEDGPARAGSVRGEGDRQPPVGRTGSRLPENRGGLRAPSAHPGWTRRVSCSLACSSSRMRAARAS